MPLPPPRLHVIFSILLGYKDQVKAESQERHIVVNVFLLSPNILQQGHKSLSRQHSKTAGLSQIQALKPFCFLCSKTEILDVHSGDRSVLIPSLFLLPLLSAFSRVIYLKNV